MLLKSSATHLRRICQLNLEDRKKLEVPFNEALKLRREGRFSEAIQILSGLAKEYPKLPAIFGMLGSIYKETGDLENSIKCFKITVDLSPKSELASLGLFHSLFKADRKDEALAEMRRFLRVSSSKEYNRLISDMNLSLNDDAKSFLSLTDETLLS